MSILDDTSQNISRTYNNNISIMDCIDPEGVYKIDYDYVFKLDLHIKDLTSIPEDVFKLTRLSMLDLSDNEIHVIPPEISKLTRLINLELSFNGMKEINHEICKLNLKRLGLGWNGITKIPSEISKLVNLRELYLNNNKLTNIPPELCQLTNLRELYLNENNIKEIPSELFQLTKLCVLDLSHNNIKNILANNNIYNFISNIFTLTINDSSYSNVDPNCEILIFSQLYNDLTKLPFNLKTIYLSTNIKNKIIDLHSNCKIIYFENKKMVKLLN